MSEESVLQRAARRRRELHQAQAEKRALRAARSKFLAAQAKVKVRAKAREKARALLLARTRSLAAAERRAKDAEQTLRIWGDLIGERLDA